MELIRAVRFLPVWGVASASPFCLKLETWLRMAQIPYEPITLKGLPRSKTGKLPYIIRPDGSILSDSGLIIDTLQQEHAVAFERQLSPGERSLAHVVRRTLEESFYFALIWERWADPAYWPTTKQAYFRELPPGIRSLVAIVARSMVRKSLHGQGTGRHPPETIRALGAADLDAVAAILGDQEYFAGKPSQADASAYGMLACLLAYPQPTPLQRAARAHPNLVAFCERMRQRYWQGDQTKLFGSKTSN